MRKLAKVVSYSLGYLLLLAGALLLLLVGALLLGALSVHPVLWGALVVAMLVLVLYEAFG